MLDPFHFKDRDCTYCTHYVVSFYLRLIAWRHYNLLLEKVETLEEAVSVARQEMLQACAKSERARAKRDEAEERAKKQEASRLELVEEVSACVSVCFFKIWLR